MTIKRPSLIQLKDHKCEYCVDGFRRDFTFFDHTSTNSVTAQCANLTRPCSQHQCYTLMDLNNSQIGR